MVTKQKITGVLNIYAVKVTVYVQHESEIEAQQYVKTALFDWSGRNQKIIPALFFEEVKESPMCFATHFL